jgi:hypothetical protein
MSEQKSMWKKEISFSRKPKEPTKPKLSKQPKTKVMKERGHTQKLVGLKIGASQLAAATVTNNGSAELLKVARRELEHGIVVGGELRDPERLSEALRQFFAENDLPRRNVRLGIANNRIGVRTFEIAGILAPLILSTLSRIFDVEVALCA